jgi:hypothetical protein
MLRNIFALIGVVTVVAIGTVAWLFGAQNKQFDPRAVKIYKEFALKLLETGDPGVAMTWAVPVEKNLSPAEVVDSMKSIAIAKNISYNGSIFNSDWTINVEGIDRHKQVEIGIIARANDKLSRIKKVGLQGANEDNLTDLIGYLMLLKIHRNKQ